MATQLFTRSSGLLSRPQQALASLLARTISSLSRSAVASRPPLPSLSVLRHLRLTAPSPPWSFSTRATFSSLRDPNPNWSNRPPQETSDPKRWLVFMEKLGGDPTRDEIIDIYIKTLAKIVGSEAAARSVIYFLSTSEEEARRCFFAFGALLSEEDALKLKKLEGVRSVHPDSYHGVKKKKDDDDGGEPCSSGLAVPTYYGESIRNNAPVNERNKTYYLDISSNFERRRESMKNNSNFQNAAPPNQVYQLGRRTRAGPQAQFRLDQIKQTQFKLGSSSKLNESKLEHEYIRLDRLKERPPGPRRAPRSLDSKLNESKFECNYIQLDSIAFLSGTLHSIDL